ncbi:MAG: pyruvate, phosphate dikinase [Saprospiraceae bacterium]|jgi:pyruvate,orthophosphate dikinase|nr:pyruvate, phosphate dikinase [Saprospiraceae bacterium]
MVATLQKNSKITETQKYVFTFGNGRAEGNTKMKNLLGGKGANLAEMNLVGIPVPAGFTLTTEVCSLNNVKGKKAVFELIKEQVIDAVHYLEEIMGTEFGNPDNPLLLSVRSGARTSMPGMMDTVLNLGLNEASVVGIAKKWGKQRFAWDSYRRLLQMYGNVVMGLKPESKEDEDPFEVVIDELKKEKGVINDTELMAEDLKELSFRFKKVIKNKTGKEFPSDPWEQLWGGIFAVFESWNNDRANVYRKLNNIPNHWGTAVNVQAMVYGNLSKNCATGVAFTRDAGTGEDIFNGEFLFNAQGEDVVAGIRTPQQITLEGSRRWAKLASVSEKERRENFPSLEEMMPEIFKELSEYETRLEDHYKDMQDIEFTIQEGKLWILQTRNGKRTGTAMVNIAMEMLEEGRIDEETALMRVDPIRLDDLLHPVFKKSALKNTKVVTQGLPASPGAATGQIVFFADEAEEWAENGKETILIRTETSPEDLRGMSVANGILTARGGMTSHAAVVARGMGKCCVSGAGAIHVDYKLRTMTVDEKVYREGDWISLNGSTGEVYEGKIETELPELSGNFGKLMDLSNKHTKMKVRTNADTPEDAAVARNFGASGIGLCRTEHMFFKGERILAIREMILADDEKGRRKALDKLLPIQRADFEGIFESMHDLPVTVRLLDPPLHEFLPHSLESQEEMAEKMGVPVNEIQEKIDSLDETNPMLGHRGCRLGITYPEITEMQTRAIIEAALNNKQKGIKVCVELMIPLIGRSKEFIQQEEIIRATTEKVFEERGEQIEYRVGTMIEIPRAALTADLIAERAEFFSFGTNDLTQMTFGFSRDDIGKFLPVYIEKGIMEYDPFKRIDENGVGKLVEFAVRKGRETRPDIKLGICGEHGGNPESIDFCHRIGLNYVSCSPYRVPIARLAAAQANIRHKG